MPDDIRITGIRLCPDGDTESIRAFELRVLDFATDEDKDILFQILQYMNDGTDTGAIALHVSEWPRLRDFIDKLIDSNFTQVAINDETVETRTTIRNQ